MHWRYCAFILIEITHRPIARCLTVLKTPKFSTFVCTKLHLWMFMSLKISLADPRTWGATPSRFHCQHGLCPCIGTQLHRMLRPHDLWSTASMLFFPLYECRLLMVGLQELVCVCNWERTGLFNCSDIARAFFRHMQYNIAVYLFTSLLTCTCTSLSLTMSVVFVWGSWHSRIFAGP